MAACVCNGIVILVHGYEQGKARESGGKFRTLFP
jgi:hypothetical protein